MLNSSNGLFFFQFSSKDGLNAMLENGPGFIRNNPLILKKWDLDVNLLKEDDGNIHVWVKLHGVPMTTSSYARAMIELRADVKLKDNIVVDMPKLVGEGFYMCMIRVEYEWRPPRCSRCKIFGHCLNECPKKIASDAVKNLNNTRQATRGVPKQGDLARQVVSNSNPFDALNSIKYDDYLGTNGGIYKSAEMGSLNVVHGSSSNNPIIDKIDKLERQIIDGKLMFVDDDENPLVHTSNVDNESEVEVVFDETTNLLAPTSSKGGNDRGYVDNSLLEQWNETYRDADYDPYDEDLYESHDMSSGYL
ncbi:ATPase, F1/V1/A1 complex, alpha/beta subunit [Tanacetum coccineum]